MKMPHHALRSTASTAPRLRTARQGRAALLLALGLFAGSALQTRAQSLEERFVPDADGGVDCIAVQPDGKILLGGGFTSINGLPRNRIARLLADGTLDTSFDPDANSLVTAIAVLPGGKILVGGHFSSIGGITHHGIALLNADGTPATNLIGNGFFSGGAGLNSGNHIESIVVQPDGKILLGGFFSYIAWQMHHNIARLDANCLVDATFIPGTNAQVNSIAVQPDGKILLGGGFFGVGEQYYFDDVEGHPSRYIARLHADGSVDTSFNPNPNNLVFSVAALSDGKILLSGFFSSIGGQPRNRFARLNADGTLDNFFHVDVGDGDPGSPERVGTIVVQPDGKILLGGNFTSINGQPRRGIARLHPNGTLDTSFDAKADDDVSSIAMQPHHERDKILVGGYFTSIGGQPRNRVARMWAYRLPAIPTMKKPKRFRATQVGKRSKAQSVRIGNIGESPLTHVSLRLGGKAAKDFRTTKPASSIAPGASSTFKVTFRPRTTGARKATLTLRSSSATPRNVPLSGKGKPKPQKKP